MRVSVVIPALNELHCLPTTLGSLRELDWISEIVVVDGGSSDGTRHWLARQPDLRVMDSPPGKGPQLNMGARAATGDHLLFLHADCRLPPQAGNEITRALALSTVAGGCFYVSFPEPRPRALRWVERGINLRTWVTGSATGDQAIFVRRKVFEEIGGCPDWPLFEDVELVRRIRRAGRFRVIAWPVTLSARRYLRLGVWRTTLLIWGLRLGFWAGVSPFRLKRWFDDIRPHVESPP